MRQCRCLAPPGSGSLDRGGFIGGRLRWRAASIRGGVGFLEEGDLSPGPSPKGRGGKGESRENTVRMPNGASRTDRSSTQVHRRLLSPRVSRPSRGIWSYPRIEAPRTRRNMTRGSSSRGEDGTDFSIELDGDI